MASTATKKQQTTEPSSQYSRLQKLLSFRFFEKTAEPKPQPVAADDYIDIVLEADFSNRGKVTSIR